MHNITQPEDALELEATSLADFIEDRLTNLCGEPRGFVLLICKTPPGESSGTGLVMSNIDPAQLPQLFLSVIENGVIADGPVALPSTH